MVHRSTHIHAATVVGAARALLLISTSAYLAGLWAAPISPMAKGFYFSVLMYGLFAAVSLQRMVREQRAGRPPAAAYGWLCAISLLLSLLLLIVGLWNSGFSFGEKGFYAMAYTLSLLAVLVI